MAIVSGYVQSCLLLEDRYSLVVRNQIVNYLYEHCQHSCSATRSCYIRVNYTHSRLVVGMGLSGLSNLGRLRLAKYFMNAIREF